MVASNLAAWRIGDPFKQPIHTSQGGVNSKRGTSSSPPCLFGSKLKITMALKHKHRVVENFKIPARRWLG
jgi:hypothetical protein